MEWWLEWLRVVGRNVGGIKGDVNRENQNTGLGLGVVISRNTQRLANNISILPRL